MQRYLATLELMDAHYRKAYSIQYMKRACRKALQKMKEDLLWESEFPDTSIQQILSNPLPRTITYLKW